MRSGRSLVAGLLVSFVILTASTGCRTTRGDKDPSDIRLQGKASWYGEEFAGRPTANGEIFDPETMTAAHRTLPFGTILDVTNLKNGLSTRVRINDRGPFVGNRIIDLSYGAARSLEMVEDGVSEVRLTIVRLGKGEREPPKPYSVKIESEPTEPVPSVRVEPHAPTPAVPPRPEPVSTIEEDPIERSEIPVETQTVPPTRAEPSPPTETVRPAGSDGSRGWKVQAGAFSIEENASRFRRELAAFVSPVYVEFVGDLYRVRVGPFNSRVDAIEVKEQLEATGYEAIVLSPDRR